MSDQFENLKTQIAKNFPVSGNNFDTNPIITTLVDWAFDYDQTQTLREIVENRLDMCSCAGCHAPDGFIYNQEAADKVPLLWDAINDAVDDYHNNTGEWPAFESVTHMVWFAIESNACDLSNFIQSTDEWAQMEAIETDPEPETLHKRFNNEILPLIKEQFEQDGL